MTDNDNVPRTHYVLVGISGEVAAPMSTVKEALEAAGVPVVDWTNLEWLLRDAMRVTRELQHAIEALSEIGFAV